MFITFEGPEGSGKSTQIDRLARRLRADGLRVVTTREPGGTALGERLRGLLLDGDIEPCAITEAYLMTAARSEHVRTVIRPALERGEWVLCDRFSDSTFAYQGAGRGIDMDDLRALQRLAVDGLAPDRTILLDIDVQEGLKRRATAGDENRFDHEEVSFHERVAAFYRQEASADRARWIVIDGSGSIENVEERIMAALTTSSNTYVPIGT